MHHQKLGLTCQNLVKLATKMMLDIGAPRSASREFAVVAGMLDGLTNSLAPALAAEEMLYSAVAKSEMLMSDEISEPKKKKRRVDTGSDDSTQGW